MAEKSVHVFLFQILAERHPVQVSVSVLSRTLAQLGLPQKKMLIASERRRAEVQAERHRLPGAILAALPPRSES
jgi:hypothetical protein